MERVQLYEIIATLEAFAPITLQENYDNAGLICGDPSWTITGAICSLDCTEAIVEEAISKNCNLIIAHHPIVFSGLKKINGKNYVEKTIIKAIKHDIAIYAAHTNLDNVLNGVNHKMAEKIGLKNLRVLLPKANILKKLVTFAPESHAEAIKKVLFEAGAGQIGNYKDCSFSSHGLGTYMALENAQPFLGKIGQLHTENEVRIEMVLPDFLKSKVIAALLKAHPYETVAYDLIALENSASEFGSGLIGDLEAEMDEMSFLKHLKAALKTDLIRHTALLNKKIKTVALCGGSGSFLLKNAISSKSDIYITGDFKYHEFFDADSKIVIADVGHAESEQFTPEIFYDLIRKKFATFAVHLSNIRTNPIYYFN
jgi:dinuclear metal center YbgI/SA1388 family protein